MHQNDVLKATLPTADQLKHPFYQLPPEAEQALRNAQAEHDHLVSQGTKNV